MQTQVGCPGGCLFCYVPSGKMLTPESLRGGQWGFEVRRKREVISKFETHLNKGELADKTIYWSGVTDPYATRTSETRAYGNYSTKRLLICALVASPSKPAIVQTAMLKSHRELCTIHSNFRGGPAVVVSYSIGTDRKI